MDSKICRWAGIIAPLVAFAFIFTAILTHPWFSFNRNALSDLGALHTENNWIFNIGLVLGGISALIFSLGIQKKGKNAVENAGYAIFLVSSIFMILIGMFPEDTGPHWYVSVLFYMTAAISIMVSGLGHILSGRKHEGALSIFMIFIALALSFGIEWGGIAVPETIGAVAITLWLYMLIFRIKICD